MSFTPTPPPGAYGSSYAGHAAPAPPAGSSSNSNSSAAAGERVILRIGGRKNAAAAGDGSRPGSSTVYQQQQQQYSSANNPPPTYAAYTRPPSSHSSLAYSSQPSSSTAAGEEVYTIRPKSGARGSAAAPSYSGYSAARGQGVPVHAGQAASASNLSRSSSAAQLPLAVALGSTSIGFAPSSLSPSNAATTTSASSSSSASSAAPNTLLAASFSAASLRNVTGSNEIIPLDSLRSPGAKIPVPLIRWAHIAPDAAAVQTKNMKAEFHANVKNFLGNAKKNIEELAAELFYEQEQAERDGEEDEDDIEADEAESAASSAARGEQKRLTAGDGAHDSTPPRTARKNGGTALSLTGASASQMGSPRKTALLQQLMSLSAHMDEGLVALTAAREQALKAAKDAAAGGGGGIKKSTASHAAKFNKIDMAQLAAMTRETLDHSPTKGKGGAGTDVSEETKQALADFVRRSQLPDRHRAYELWVSSKAASQAKAQAKAARREKEARLAELQAQRAQKAESAERERAARIEEEALRAELEAQRKAEAAEEAARAAEEARERARLESERREREELRRKEREAEQARQRLEDEMLKRAEEQARWEAEKRQKEQAEDEARRITEELKREVVKDLALATQQHAQADQSGGSAEAEAADEQRDAAELDALFAQANQGPDDHTHGRRRGDGGEDEMNTDEEFADLQDEIEADAAAARPPLPPGSSRMAAPPHAAASASQGRKGRTVARTVAQGLPSMGSFPAPPALPSSALQGSPQTARERATAAAAARAMSFGAAAGGVAPSTNYRFERAKRMHGR